MKAGFRRRNIVWNSTTVHFQVGYSNVKGIGGHISTLNIDGHRAVCYWFYYFLIAWVPTAKLDTFYLSRLKLQCQKLALVGNTYHWIQLAKWMEYWQKFSFITSFSKGLIGYSLRNSGEREAAVSMSGIVGWVERECREECRGRSWGPGKQENTSKKILHLLRDPKVLTWNRLEVCFV